ncbi:probable zinc transporter 12 [Abrus precatorius]|uniref:Probable zinc transporter 12 n=1 Tax=Abrus precatorius TaxID=3816 RepID=A0A8B8LS87_ABRPR|nr:probable zinc transporter 12 [Abrus precatorius]
MIKFSTCKILITTLTILLQQNLVFSKCHCDNQTQGSDHKVSEALKYKLIAMASVSVASLIGVCLPIFAKNFSLVNPKNDLYLLVKAFAAGVILATGFVHILPEAFEALTNPCIGEKPWRMFPFSGFVAMVGSTVTLIIETLVMGCHKRSKMTKAQTMNYDEETHADDRSNHVHSSSLASERQDSADLRNVIVSQILELGILLHSIILGISLGVSANPNTIKPLVLVISFHQCFEGMGLGECISQAQFKYYKIAIMVLFFGLIFPIGISIGIGISNIYHERSPKALIVEGFLLSASAGILIYMALVDLLANDFMSTKMLRSFRLQLGPCFALLMGLICMSILALWEEA